MDCKNRATENIAIERFFRSYKWEHLYMLNSETVTEVRLITKEYIAKYNNERGATGRLQNTATEIMQGFDL